MLAEDDKELTAVLIKVLTAVVKLPDADKGANPEAMAEVHRRQTILNALGGGRVMLMMIMSEADVLCAEGLKFGIALLWGGNSSVQKTVHSLLTEAGASVEPFDGSSATFLDVIRRRIELGAKEIKERKFFLQQQADRSAMLEADWESGLVSPSVLVAVRAELSQPFASRAFVVDVLELLRLCCEGHFNAGGEGTLAWARKQAEQKWRVHRMR